MNAAVFGDQHVGPAVVVDVADGHAHAMAGDVQAGPLAYVGEFAVGSLPKQAIGGPRLRPTILEEVNVEPAVVVEVEKGGARTHDLRHEIIAHGSGVVNKVKADFVGDVYKPRRTTG